METNSVQKVSCVVNYAYDASKPDELTIRPGEVLREVERLPGGWWRGELRGRRGMFPDNFVSLVTDHGVKGSSGVQGRCRSVFSYQPANPDELPLCVGDVLEVLGEVEEGWWQGRRGVRVGVFPSNFVVMLDPQPTPQEPAPKLPPKPDPIVSNAAIGKDTYYKVKEQCQVLFPYTAVNEDELTLAEGDIVTVLSREAPDRGWWRGELRGRQGLFPDNFVQLLPAAEETEEKKPDRPPTKTPNNIYPILNKYSEKTNFVKELSTSRVSLHKENAVNKESSTQNTVTHTNKIESDKTINSETVSDGTLDVQTKKPPVPLKKSPTPTSGVGGLLSGLKSKITSITTTSVDKDKSTASATSMSSGSSSGGEWDKPDGAAVTRPGGTFDHIERNSILNDPRAGRVKAPRRRPPSQALREDTLQQIGLSNGHEAEKPTDKDDKVSENAEEIKPRAREWEKHKAPWMAELKLNQAKKTSFGEVKSRSVSSGSEGGVSKSGSTDRILDCGLEEKRSSHSMEMSKSTSSISSRLSVMESFEESTKVRHSPDSKKDSAPPLPTSEPPASKLTSAQSPTAAGRTFSSMLDELKPKPLAPSPPAASVRTHNDTERSPSKLERTLITSEKQSEVTKTVGGLIDKSSTVERTEEKSERSSTLERRMNSVKSEKGDSNEVLIAQLNSRITNLEKLLEVQNAKFTACVEELTKKLAIETERRLALHAELAKLAHCVTQV